MVGWPKTIPTAQLFTTMQSSHPSSGTSPHTTATKTLADLEKLTREYSSATLNHLDGFAKYWNEFDRIARTLIEANIINKAERDLYFWIGLPFTFRKLISQKLLTTMGGAHHERLIPTWRDTIQAGRHVFNDPSVGWLIILHISTDWKGGWVGLDDYQRWKRHRQDRQVDQDSSWTQCGWFQLRCCLCSPPGCCADCGWPYLTSFTMDTLILWWS